MSSPELAGMLEIATLSGFHGTPISEFNPSTEKIDLDGLVFSAG